MNQNDERKTQQSSLKNEMNQTAAKPTALQIGAGLIIVGASAGLTLYTKKTQSILAQMKQVERNREIRMPKKYGPPTKQEWEKIRPRW